MKKLLNLPFTQLILIIVFVSACKKDITEANSNDVLTNELTRKKLEVGFAENDMVMYWNDKTAQVLKNVNPQPYRARLFAYTQIAVHDALNSIKPKYQRYAYSGAKQQFASTDAAIASAAYWAIKNYNLQGAFPVDSWYAESLATIPDGDSKEQGKALGKAAADAIRDKRANDGFSLVIIASPNPPNGTLPGQYRQTGGIDLRFVANWGIVMQPLSLQSNQQFRPGNPYPLGSVEYAADYNEVKLKGASVNSTRTAEEDLLAHFWGEYRVSNLWNDFTREVVKTKKLDAWKTARVFAVLHAAMFDGVNCVLESAYYYYSWRPVTAIREGDTDGNSGTVGDPAWQAGTIEGYDIPPGPGQNISPTIPEYAATYSVSGGITAAVLQSVLGTDKIDIDFSQNTVPGTVLHYTSLSKAARDNSLAKIWAGWHFRNSVLIGEEMGKQVANYTLQHEFTEQ